MADHVLSEYHKYCQVTGSWQKQSSWRETCR